MKHFLLESAFLASLVIVTGCGESASPEFVDFKQTAPSELAPELQKPAEDSTAINGSVNVAPVSNSKESNPSENASVGGAAPNSVNTNGNDVVAALPTPDSPVPAADTTKDPVANSADATGQKLIVSRQSGLTGPRAAGAGAQQRCAQG